MIPKVVTRARYSHTGQGGHKGQVVTWDRLLCCAGDRQDRVHCLDQCLTWFAVHLLRNVVVRHSVTELRVLGNLSRVLSNLVAPISLSLTRFRSSVSHSYHSYFPATDFTINWKPPKPQKSPTSTGYFKGILFYLYFCASSF